MRDDVQEININNKKFKYLKGLCDDGDYILYVPGFQSSVNLRLPLLHSLNHNYITFDFPATYMNNDFYGVKAFPSGEEIYRDTYSFIKAILESYKIRSVIFVSLSSILPFTKEYFELFNKYDIPIIIISPQVSFNYNDNSFSVLSKIILFLSKLFKIDIYHRLMNWNFFRKFWLDTIAKESRNERTIELQVQSLNSVDVYGDVSLYLYIQQKKKELFLGKDKKTNYLNRMNFFIGKKDNLFDASMMNSLFKEIDFGSIQKFDSNHVLEMEATKEVAEGIKSIINHRR